MPADEKYFVLDVLGSFML